MTNEQAIEKAKYVCNCCYHSLPLMMYTYMYKPVVEVARDEQCCVHARDKLSRTERWTHRWKDRQINLCDNKG